MIKSFSTPTLSANQATLTRVIHAKSSLPAMLFAGIGGFMAAPAKLQNPTSITNSNKQPITIKLDSSYVDYEFSHYTKRCRNKAHKAYIENGRDRRSKEEAGCYGDGFFLRTRLAGHIQRGYDVSVGAEKTGRSGRSRAQKENGEGLDESCFRGGKKWAVQFAYWQRSQGTILSTNNGRA